MTPRMHDGHVIEATEDLLQKIEIWLKGQPMPIWSELEAAEIRHCIAQAVLTRMKYPFARKCAADIEQSGRIRATGVVSDFGGLTFDLESGQVRVRFKTWLYGAVIFICLGIKHLMSCLRGCLRRREAPKKPVTILSSMSRPQIIRNNNDEVFSAFCDGTPVRPLSDAERILIELGDAPRQSSNSRVSYTRNAINFLLSQGWSGRREIMACFFWQICWMLRGLLDLIQYPICALVANDMASVEVVRRLDNRNQIGHWVYTVSACDKQPLWVRLRDRRFRVHIIHYSENSMPYKFKGDEKELHFSNMRRFYADEQWVWTKEFSQYLGRIGHNSLRHVVGPILWYLPDKRGRNEHKGLNVGCFDVLPLSQEFRDELGIIRNYWNVDTLKKFVDDVLSVTNEIENRLDVPIQILLKHKRNPCSGHHDMGYIEHINDLAADNHRLELIDHDANIYNLIDNCHLTISFPFTSTALVSYNVGCSTLYYDPADILEPRQLADKIKFVSKYEELIKCMAVMIKEVADKKIKEI